MLKILDRDLEIVLGFRIHLDGPNIGFSSDESSKVCRVVLCWVESGQVTYVFRRAISPLPFVLSLEVNGVEIRPTCSYSIYNLYIVL